MKKTKLKISFENIIGVFAWLSLFLAVFISVTTVFAVFTGEENGKEIFGHKLLIVTSDSMSKSALSEEDEVFFNAGDLIVIKTVDEVSGLKEGDVITFVSRSPESYGKTLSHKIRRITYGYDGEISGFVTYGINTGVNDTVTVAPETVIGKYSFKLPTVGNIFAFLKTSRGYYLSVLIPAVLLIIYFSTNIGRALGKRQVAAAYNEEIEVIRRRVGVLEQMLGIGTAPVSVPEAIAVPSTAEADSCLEETRGGEDADTGLSIPRGKRVSFSARVLNLEKEHQAFFNLIHNELISYRRVNSRLSFKCMSYRYGRRLLAKLSVSGRTLRLHLNLETEAFNENIFHQRDMSAVKAYSEVPFTVKLKSPRGVKNAIRLIGSLAEKFELRKNNKIQNDTKQKQEVSENEIS